MIRSDLLPKFVFIGSDGSEQHLTPSMRAGRIRAIAARIAEAIGPDAPPAVPVGLMFQSGPDLVLGWLGCVLAGMQPLVMQYPTAKQSRAYWESSVSHTIRLTGLRLVLCDSHAAGLGLGLRVPVLAKPELDALPDGHAEPFAIMDFAAIQLSSGTTGHRKAVRLRGAGLLRHVQDYNQVLGLTRADRIVSWLPLYHDMGYVACFIMPLLLGVDMVMMDPITWVRRPGLLFDAIERHGGTHCYMPNFGFEVMAREAARPLASMRRWISCSEPVSPGTARRFMAAIGQPGENFAACYAMAENIFAVTFGSGIETRRIGGVEVASCGAAIPGVALRLVDGEIWVRSPTSLTAYVGGDDIRDEDGFYPTGDLGELHDGALFVTGRKQDLLIQAGRKFMLSDIDLAVNRLFPAVRGRAAALAMHDRRLGTELPLVLIEAEDFYDRGDGAEMAGAVREEMELDQLEVAFVPPRFLTKTSSGKFNRRLSAVHWAGVLRQRQQGAHRRADPVAELRAALPRVPTDRPVGEVLDSLSLTVLRIILSGAGQTLDPGRTLADIEAGLRAGAPESVPQGLPGVLPEAGGQSGLRIVSLADRHTMSRLAERHLDGLAARLGCPVTLEHVCLPPSPVILSDLIFTDYFLPRLADQAPFSSVQAELNKLRGASLILVDDGAELRMPPNQAYGVLSHNLERDPRADLITVRWQHYARQHHLLPLTFVAGRDLALDERDRSLAALQAYLGRKLFRIASYAGLSAFTEGWDFRSFPGSANPPFAEGLIRPGRLMAAIGDWVARENPPLVPLRPGPRLEMLDLGHYCSHFADQKSIDRLLASYGSFCIAGQDASIPYIRQALDRAGKPYAMVPSFAPEILATVEQPYECLLICGAWGDYQGETPAAAIMFAAYAGARTFNIADRRLAALSFKRNASFDPPSATDWFYPGRLHRDWPLEVWSAQRAAAPRAAVPRGQALRDANRHSLNGDPQAAYEAARRALDLSPGNARALAALARAARALGQLDEARDWAGRALAAAPEEPAGYRLLAAIAMDQSDYAAAARLCAEAERKMPEEAAEFARLRERARRKEAVLS
jgi:acyl-CoA synthetase (AMP-forming)/AMP-acid ligase II/tetratricopeptide (TPR) repeat protein